MKILINLIVIIFFFTFQISYQSPLKIHPNTSEAFEKGDWVALALISSVALGIYAFGFSDSKKKDNASSSSNNSDNDSDPSSNTSGGNWFEVINATGGQTKTLKGLDYNRDWIFEVEMKSINVGYRQRLIKEGDGYLDVWFEGSNSLAWRLYNKKIWLWKPLQELLNTIPILLKMIIGHKLLGETSNRGIISCALNIKYPRMKPSFIGIIKWLAIIKFLENPALPL